MSDSYWARFQQERLSRRRLLAASAVGGSAALLLAACGGDSSPSSEPSSPSEPSGPSGVRTPDKEGPASELAANQTMVNRYRNDLLRLDPATIFGVEQESAAVGVYSGLTRYDRDSELVADLAKNWEQPGDGTTIVFHLNDAKWQKGYGDVTAEDVAWSYNRVIQSGGAYAFEFELVDRITATDAKTVEIKLKKPFANFLHVVANYHQGQVVSRSAVEKLGDDIWLDPVGSGPFIISDVVPGQGFKMTRHEEYFRGPATIKSHDFRRIDAVDTSAIALQNGEVDTFMYVNEVVWDSLTSDPNIRLSVAVNDFLTLWLLNTTIPALADARVRQAMFHAMDLKTVIETTTPNTANVIGNIIPDWMPEYSPDVPKYDFDPKKAKDLLAASGADVSVKFLTSGTPGEAQQLQQSYLAQVGIKLDFEIADRSTYNSRRLKGEFESSSRGLPGMFIEELLFQYLHPDNFVPKGFNAARYNNPEVTAKMEQARSELDLQKRKSIYAEVQKQVMTDLPYIPVSGGNHIWACRADIRGMAVNRLSEIDWYPLQRAKA